jgi:hypothetical protein
MSTGARLQAETGSTSTLTQAACFAGGLCRLWQHPGGHSVKIEPAGPRSAVGLVRRAVLHGAMKVRSRRGPTGRFYPSAHADQRAGFNHVAVQV